jgi:hypothetical protein
MDNDENFRKSLDYIQGIIDRLASNSFKIKGWTVALVVAALLFRSNRYQFLSAFIPLFGFWYLDAYYLRLERKYREMYQRRIADPPEETKDLLALETKGDYGVCPTFLVMWSRSLVWFYGIIFVLLAVYGLLVVVSPMQFSS